MSIGRRLLEHIIKLARAHAPRWLRRRWTRGLDSPEVYERLYASPERLAEYLSSERTAFYREVAGHCWQPGAKRILDVACGPGGFLAAMSSVAEAGSLLCGLDRCAAGLRAARGLCPTALLARGDLYRPCYREGAFDLVVCTQTFEHLDAPRRALEALARLCAPGGRLVITIPDGARDQWAGHLNRWREDQFRNLCGRERVISSLHITDGRNLLFMLRPIPAGADPVTGDTHA